MVIQSKINTNMKWEVKTKSLVSKNDIEFIENLNITIYTNDYTGKAWHLIQNYLVANGWKI